MAESTASVGRSGSEIEAASVSRFEHLIDIPFSEKMIDSLIALFNYFDIYAPRMELLYTIITFLRFFQLIGGSFMAANLDSFAENTLAQKVVSVITVLFHVVPLEYRRGNEMIILGVVNGILLIMGIYLQVTAFSYKSTSKVPKASLLILSVYLAIGPFLLVPISAQYTGQLLSAYIQGTCHNMLQVWYLY
ncbi:hypothetical protein TVAG_383490 [Trichomonas vaginalis G3]|uniref:Uncharacterized protein n=1 Tax=Trichomonas vaginalis (strain ATCC PRA-98 / G3) TaxID=412133 RepID=A2EZ58_TRIV3|nr:guanylate cyclase protein [Trichomonas vaginalis G3]EAY02046.1 hypothetical protein TVAG_383490 [Trichomonas vaginalis G3]KAI5514277.1 guanylate cyclase protein [Trichomonas vaginalis G3]|eukprot:XP_001330500.1 hypothetical protein [Trichomonas vaginalis G3]